MTVKVSSGFATDAPGGGAGIPFKKMAEGRGSIEKKRIPVKESSGRKSRQKQTFDICPHF